MPASSPDVTDSRSSDLGADEGPAPPPNLATRAWMVFFQPGALFRRLAGWSPWFWVLLLTSVVAGATIWFIPDEAWTAMIREGLQSAGQVGEAPLPEAMGVLRVAGVVSAAVWLFVMSLLLSAFTYVTFVFLLGDQGTYKEHLSIIAHAGVVPAVGAVLVLPLRVMNMDPQLTLSVGTLFPFLADGYWYGVLRSLDLFGLWAAVLTGLGLSILDPRRGWGSAASVMVGLAVVFALIAGYFV